MIDPITLEVVTEGLISVVREMRATVFRTARSVAIYDARDFSCGLFDAAGQDRYGIMMLTREGAAR